MCVQELLQSGHNVCKQWMAEYGMTSGQPTIGCDNNLNGEFLCDCLKVKLKKKWPFLELFDLFIKANSNK